MWGYEIFYKDMFIGEHSGFTNEEDALEYAQGEAEDWFIQAKCNWTYRDAHNGDTYQVITYKGSEKVKSHNLKISLLVDFG